MSELQLNTEEMASSAFRVFTGILGISKPWDHLAIEEQERWLRVAKRAEQSLVRCESKPWAAAAQALQDLYLSEESPVHPKAITAWEAVARHLVCLFDCDEIVDLAELEKSWLEWAANRRAA